jgi:hypothetical protein
VPNESKALYLFNSAYRSEYLINAMRTLALPHGATNDYGYATAGDAVHVIAAHRRPFSELPVNCPVVIIFVDRFHVDDSGLRRYYYHPLRRGALVRAWQEGERFFFRVRLLGDAVARDAASFSASVADALVGDSPTDLGAPRLVNGDPEYRADGQYAVLGPVLCDDQTCGSSLEEWHTLTQRLDQTTAFRTSKERPVVYARFTVSADMVNAPPDAEVLHEGASRFVVERGRQLRLVANYRFPLQSANTSAAVLMNIAYGEGLVPRSETTVLVAAVSRRIELPFSAEPFGDAIGSNISLNFSSVSPGTTVLAPQVNLPFRLEVPRVARLALAPMLILYLLGTVISGFDFTKLGAGEGVNLLLKLVGASAQAAALFWMITQYGKKIA